MFKQIVALIALSILVIMFTTYSQVAVQGIVEAHNWISELLTQVFTGGPAGDITRKLLALLTIPVGIAFIPALLYWFVRRQWFPFFMHLVWVLWLVQTAALVIQFKPLPI